MKNDQKINPIIDEPGMSDPHALVLDDICYLFTGHDIGFGVDDWVMPDWRIYRSTDLRKWTHVGTISPADNFMGAGNTNCWGGDIVERNGKFYWYFSNRKHSTGVMVANKPAGPYRDILGKPLVDSFDPSIFVDEDNTPYLIYGEGDYKIARLRESMIELAEEPRTLELNRQDAYPWADKNSLHKHNGIYYLSWSGYYATATNIYGPYKYRGCVGEGLGLDSGYAHGDFFVWKGKWYHVWCKYRDRKYDRIRDCFTAPVIYDADGSMHDDLDNLLN